MSIPNIANRIQNSIVDEGKQDIINEIKNSTNIIQQGFNPLNSSNRITGFIGGGNVGNNGAGGPAGNPNLGGGASSGNDFDLVRLTAPDKQAKEVGWTINDPRPDGKTAPPFKGRASIINPYYLVRYQALSRYNEDAKHVSELGVKEGERDNYQGLADYPQYKNPSTSLIIAHYNEDASMYPERVYRYSDFLYLKHYHPFSNNRLITLRRFLAPVYDECRVAIKSANNKSPLRKPIAKALSYLDASGNTLSRLSKMNVGIKTKGTQGAIDNVTTLNDAETVLGYGVGNDQNLGLKLLSYLSMDNPSDRNMFETWTSTYDPWKTGPLQDLVYGPVNVITGVLIRDRGLTFKHTEPKIIFEYSSKTMENINQKGAMLDILSNMLALTYNHALFWGGENRYLIDRANFPLVRAEVLFSLFSDPDNLDANLKKVASQLGGSANNLLDNFGEMMRKLRRVDAKDPAAKDDGMSPQTVLTQLVLSDHQKLKKLHRQILEGTKAELTGAPTGEWHLQVGNPFAPIMMMGNLWCKSADFEFNDELSFEDFPTELKVTVTLDHGRDRDSGDIQSIYNGGAGRIYYPQKDAEVDVNNSYSTENSWSPFTLKDTDVLGSTNRVNVDRSGQNISKFVKKDSRKKIVESYLKPLRTGNLSDPNVKGFKSKREIDEENASWDPFQFAKDAWKAVQEFGGYFGLDL